ncbi:MAG: (5-formylfuran-3-yl)methyl phosphate synthase [Lewinellaceae bacterium]|nr:(5-formylfuran-3-yl)methyl phosphate synthase [Phaeodactylibacter sp.]MCB9352711.1 (5-formylfuran-3-yl)methyl phosphate synthase [Lewinellaceae bacterium]
MKVLISVVSLAEARIAIKGGADILDIKNPLEGSLGAQFPWVLKEIAQEVKGSGILCSAALGDLPFKPGTAALAAFGAASCGAEYIKAGLLGAKNYQEAFEMMNGVAKATRLANPLALVVAAGYADYNRFGGIPYSLLVSAAADAGADVVMLDTAIKDGKALLDVMDRSEILRFIALGHEAGMQVALAGSIKEEHLEALSAMNPDVIGIRGAVCSRNDRKAGIAVDKVKAFLTRAKALSMDTPLNAYL